MSEIKVGLGFLDEEFDLIININRLGDELARELNKDLKSSLKLQKLVKEWASDEGYSHAEVCKELLEESEK